MDMRWVAVRSGLGVMCGVKWWWPCPWNSRVGVFDNLCAAFFSFLNNITGTRPRGGDLKFSWTCVSASRS